MQFVRLLDNTPNSFNQFAFNQGQVPIIYGSDSTTAVAALYRIVNVGSVTSATKIKSLTFSTCTTPFSFQQPNRGFSDIVFQSCCGVPTITCPSNMNTNLNTELNTVYTFMYFAIIFWLNKNTFFTFYYCLLII